MSPIPSGPLRVMVVDDTVVYRKIVSDVVAEIPGVEVAAVASNGKIALAKIEHEPPDLITLDIEMPVMDGLELLARLADLDDPPGVIMLSTHTHEGGALTMRALELGAFDFIPKPQSGALDENREFLRKELAPRLTAYQRQRDVRRTLAITEKVPRPATRTAPKAPPSTLQPPPWTGGDVLGIGVSTGGPNALSKVIPALPGDLGVPVVVVQHMPSLFTRSLAESLDKKCALTVREATDGERLEAGTVLIAPGGRQMKFAAGLDGLSRIVRITDDPPENNCRPAVDYTFRSLARYYANRTVAVILTGMGRDGTEGLKRLKRTGCRVLAQDEASSVVWGMPGAAVEAGVVDQVVPLGEVARSIVTELGCGQRPGVGHRR